MSERRFPRLASLVIALAAAAFGFVIWFVADPSRGAAFDRYIIFNVDDLWRYNYVKMALHDARVFLNPYVKPVYAAIGSVSLAAFPLGISGLRIANAAFSVGTLILIARAAVSLGLAPSGAWAAVALAASFPVYFLVSVSTLVEMPFCFFLMLGVYWLLKGRFTRASLVFALLPLLRQEALLLVPVMLALLPARLRLKHGVLALLPFVLWSAANRVFLGHTFFYTFWCNLPDRAPANCIAPFAQFFRLAMTLVLHPLFAACAAGLALKGGRKKLVPVFPFFAAYAAILAAANILHLEDSGYFSREIRFLMPLVPFMALYAGYAVERLARGPARKAALAAAFVLLPGLTFFQIHRMQSDDTVVWDSLSGEQEEAVRQAGLRISAAIRDGGITRVYVPGDMTTDKVIRRLWGYLPGETRYYALIGKMETYEVRGIRPLDMASYTLEGRREDVDGLLLSTMPASGEGIAAERLTPLFQNPVLPVYVYRVQRAR